MFKVEYARLLLAVVNDEEKKENKNWKLILTRIWHKLLPFRL